MLQPTTLRSSRKALMTLIRPLLMLLLCSFLAIGTVALPCVVPTLACAATAAPHLVSPPLGDRWFSIAMNGERTGFGYTRIVPNPRGYEIIAEGSAKMLVLGFSREAASREHYLVNKDLSLRSFSVEQIIDGSAMNVKGEVGAKGIKVVVETKGNSKERLLKTKGAVFPPAVLNIYPLMQGVAPGRTYRLKMLDVEAVKVKDVKITAVGPETMPDGVRAFHLQNDLYSFVSNDVWVDLAGNTLRESVRDGMIETRAEQEQSARRFVVEAALAKKDLILDFSRVPLDEPIDNPQKLAFMKVEISGFPEAVPLLEGEGQQVSRVGRDIVLVDVARQKILSATLKPSPPEPRHTAASEWIPSDNREIAALKDDIIKGESDPAKVVEKLNVWVAENIREAVTDSHSPLETLFTRAGNCQSHARLYVSLARAAGIPSKFVSGLVYVADKGFLYHSWAESFIGKWIAVDPTFNEVPANATHVKLAEGDSPQDMAPIIGLIGRIKMKVLEKRYEGDN